MRTIMLLYETIYLYMLFETSEWKRNSNLKKGFYLKRYNAFIFFVKNYLGTSVLGLSQIETQHGRYFRDMRIQVISVSTGTTRLFLSGKPQAITGCGNVLVSSRLVIGTFENITLYKRLGYVSMTKVSLVSLCKVLKRHITNMLRVYFKSYIGSHI